MEVKQEIVETINGQKVEKYTIINDNGVQVGLLTQGVLIKGKLTLMAKKFSYNKMKKETLFTVDLKDFISKSGLHLSKLVKMRLVW